MVASDQMVTSDSPGSALMKWTMLQQEKLKTTPVFFVFLSWGHLFGRNIFSEWIKSYVRGHKLPLEMWQIYSCHDPRLMVFHVICTPCQICIRFIYIDLHLI